VYGNLYSPGNKHWAVGWLIAKMLWLKLNVIILYEGEYRNNVTKRIYSTIKAPPGEKFQAKFSVTSEVTKHIHHKDEIQASQTYKSRRKPHISLPNQQHNFLSL
jgi:hypothetical protein